MTCRSLVVTAVAFLTLVGCDVPEIEIPTPAEPERAAFESLLTTQQDVGNVSVSIAVLHVVVSREGADGAVDVQLTPNARATLPRFGRLSHPRDALAEPGAYVAVTNMMGEIVFLLKIADGSLTVGEGPTAGFEDPPDLLEGVASSQAGFVVSTRVPLELGGKLTIFTTGPNGLATPVVEEMLAVISFGPDAFPRRGRRYRVEP